MANEGHTTRRLVRRTDDKIVAGVCSGLADHLGVDPLLVRIGFVALGLTGGGVLAYLVAWALLPAAGEPAPASRLRTASLGVVLLVIAGGIAFLAVGGFVMNILFPLIPGGLHGLSPEPMGLAAVLVVIGILLLRGRDETAGAEAASPPATDAATAAARPARVVVRRPRERSGLTPLTLAVALLVGGIAALLANAGAVSLDVGQVTALSLLVVGLGLVVGAWFGRARLLIPVAILMTPFVLVASLVDFPPSGSVGSGYVMPQRAGELENVRVLAGQVTYDLSEYPFAEGTEEARMRVAAGSVNVYVPKDVYVEVWASVRGGEAYVFGGHEQGFDVSVVDSAGPRNAARKLKLELVAGFGTVGVYRVGASPQAERRRDDAREERRGSRARRPERSGTRDKRGDRPEGETPAIRSKRGDDPNGRKR